MLKQTTRAQRRPTLQLPQTRPPLSIRQIEGTQARVKFLLEKNKEEVTLLERSPAAFSNAQINITRKEPIQSKAPATKPSLQELIKSSPFINPYGEECINELDRYGMIKGTSVNKLVYNAVEVVKNCHQDPEKTTQIIDYLTKLMWHGCMFLDNIIPAAFYNLSLTPGISSSLKDTCHMKILECWQVHSLQHNVLGHNSTILMEFVLLWREPSPIIVKTYLELTLSYLKNTSHCYISREAKYAINHILAFYRTHPDYITYQIQELCSENDIYLFIPQPSIDTKTQVPFTKSFDLVELNKALSCPK